MEKRYLRSKTDAMLGGVCSGLAKYLAIDVTIVRLFFVVFTLLGGIGPLVYIILWIVIPEEGKTPEDSKVEVFTADELKERAEGVRDDFITAVKKPNQDSGRLIGITLVVVGGFLVLKQLNLPWLSWLNTGFAWAVLIMVAGIVLLVRALRKE